MRELTFYEVAWRVWTRTTNGSDPKRIPRPYGLLGFRRTRRATFRWSCIPPVDVYVVYKQRRGTRSLIDRKSTPERKINKWVHRPRQFRWSRLAPNSLSVEKKHHRLRGQINAERMVIINQDAIGNIDFLTDPEGFFSILPNVQVGSIARCVMTIVFDNVDLNAGPRGSYGFQRR